MNAAGGLLGETALQWALRKSLYRMASILLMHQADLHHRSYAGCDALHLVVQLNDDTAVFLLLTWGADPNSQNNDGETALCWYFDFTNAS